MSWSHFAKKSNSLSPEPTKEPRTYAIIIGVSLGGLYVVLLWIIFFVRFCKNRNVAHRRKRALGIMPPEKTFPNPEKYELKSVAVNNAYVALGEISHGCDKQMKDFTDTMASPTVKGTFVLVLVNLHSVFSKISNQPM